MTTNELDEILDDENRKLTADELKEVVYQLKCDVFNEALKADDNEDIYHLGYYNGETNAFQVCLDLLEHFLYKAGYRKKEWISVDEIVPKKRQKCLCYYPEKDYGSKVVVDYAETDNGGFAEQFKFGKPSHWMPIPKTPKMKGGVE